MICPWGLVVLLILCDTVWFVCERQGAEQSLPATPSGLACHPQALHTELRWYQLALCWPSLEVSV